MLSKMYCKVIVVACLVVGIGVFAGYARADFIYEYDFSRTSTGALDANDTWVSDAGNQVSSGAAGWTGQGNYVESNSSSHQYAHRVNDIGWSYSLVNNRDFDYSAILRSKSTSYFSYAMLSEDAVSKVHVAVLGSTRTFQWAGPWTAYSAAVPTTADTMFLVGLEATHQGGGVYSIRPYYQNLTLGTAKVYPNDGGTAITSSAIDLTELNAIMVRTRYSGARVDNIRISQSEIPEPGTLALLATGLIGLLAYAWRKRK